MRYIGLILALGAICWVLYQAAGGGKAESVIPVEQQRSLDKAKSVEQSMQDAAKKSMEEAEKKSMQ
jgi:hypothetical protein